MPLLNRDIWERLVDARRGDTGKAKNNARTLEAGKWIGFSRRLSNDRCVGFSLVWSVPKDVPQRIDPVTDDLSLATELVPF